MKKGTYKITKQAAQDLEEIWLYTYQTWPVEQADRYFNLIIDEIKHLSKNVKGQPVDYIRVATGFQK